MEELSAEVTSLGDETTVGCVLYFMCSPPYFLSLMFVLQLFSSIFTIKSLINKLFAIFIFIKCDLIHMQMMFIKIIASVTSYVIVK